jgi:hypothetical protein
MRYIVLLVILVFLLLVCYFAYGYVSSDIIKSLILNLSTELIGAGFAYFIFDQILISKERRDSIKKTNIACKQFNSTITEYINLFQMIYKATSDSMIDTTKNEIEDVFNDHFFESIRLLKITANAPVLNTIKVIDNKIVENHPTWKEYLLSEFAKLENLLESSLVKYAGLIDNEQLEALLAINNTKISESIKMYNKMVEIKGNMENGFNQPNTEIPFSFIGEQGINKIVANILIYNNVIKKMKLKELRLKVDMNIWDKGNAPTIGESRYVIKFE